jgi:hypothetical protein
VKRDRKKLKKMEDNEVGGQLQLTTQKGSIEEEEGLQPIVTGDPESQNLLSHPFWKKIDNKFYWNKRYTQSTCVIFLKEFKLLFSF